MRSESAAAATVSCQHEGPVRAVLILGLESMHSVVRVGGIAKTLGWVTMDDSTFFQTGLSFTVSQLHYKLVHHPTSYK